MRVFFDATLPALADMPAWLPRLLERKKSAPVAVPKIPSRLIRLALGYLTKAEKSPDYRINMHTWHTRVHIPVTAYDVTEVCLAGAVMAFGLGADRATEYQPISFDNERHQLLALDCFRAGVVGEGFETLGLAPELGHGFDRNVCRYSNDPSLFHDHMNRLADDLETAGY